MKPVYASIITIGDELLIGQTVDTNSAFIAQELNKIGIWVRRRVAVGDDYDAIWDALDEESEASQVIIITGGLGPTADDITKPLLCDYFGGKMVLNQQVLDHVTYLFEKVFKRTGPLLERNIRQAEVPDVCEVLFNKRGTAPGMMFAPKAPLNPPQGGTLASHSREISYSYETGDTLLYGKLKEFAEEHRKQPTEAENVLWQLLKGRKLSGFKFRRQHIIGPFIADFVCLSQKLIIEVDGLIHQLPENKLSDEERTEALKEKGFEVIRFTNEEVLYSPDQTLNCILARVKEEKQLTADAKNPPLQGRETQGPIFFSLPGVPFEMKGLMTEEVIPRLVNMFKLPAIIHRTAFTAGQGESYLAEMLKEFEPSLPPHIKLAYLPNFGMVKLRLTAIGDDRETLEKEIGPHFERLQELVKDYLVANEDIGLEIIVGRLLQERGKTLGTAESCTGGYIAHQLTSVPGSSAYYKGSVISYANDVKEGILDVSESTLQKHGAVSRDTVTEMAKGAIRKLGVDYVVATSGIMGPDGGSPEKPVGTVWIAVANADRVESHQLLLRFERDRNIRQTATTALNLLRKFILAS